MEKLDHNLTNPNWKPKTKYETPVTVNDYDNYDKKNY